MHVWGGGGGMYSAVLVGVWSAVGTCAYICMGGMYGAVVVDVWSAGPVHIYINIYIRMYGEGGMYNAVVVDVWSAGGTCAYVCMGRGDVRAVVVDL